MDKGKHRRSIGDTPTGHRRYSDGASIELQEGFKEASEGYTDNHAKALNETQQKILFLLSRDAQIPASKIAEQIQISRRNVEANIKKLKERGILIRHGSPKSGYWEIVK